MRACVLIVLALSAGGAFAQPPWPRCDAAEETLQDVARALLCVIEQLSGYRTEDLALPQIVQLPQHEIEAKVCEEPCNVSAAYVPREGIFIAGNLDPLRSVEDRAALLHELVHHLQQGHAKFAHLTGCARERAKEEEAYALQNAYLVAAQSNHRAVFPAGDFACGTPPDEGPR